MPRISSGRCPALRLHGALAPVCVVLLALGSPAPVHATWPANGAPVCTALGSQSFPLPVPDGTGGVYVAWKDDRHVDFLPPYDIYVQHLAADGTIFPGWPLNGVSVAGNDYLSLAVAPDGASGLYVAWDGYAIGYPTYLQRIDPSGTPAPGWPSEGLVLCTVSSLSGREFALAPDGAGGVFAVWSDWRTSDYDVFAQHVSPSGQFLWSPCGVPVSRALGSQNQPVVIADQAGGIYAAWLDHRGGASFVYAQHLDATGLPAAGWETDGNPVCVANSSKASPQLAPSGNDGVIVVWTDGRNGNDDVFGLRMTAGGAVSPGWAVDGTPLCIAPGDQTLPYPVTDGANGAIVFWEDGRSAITNGFDVYASRIASDGTRPSAWPPDGLGVCTESGDQLLSSNPHSAPAAPDGAGGAYVTWFDRRAGGSFDSDIYIQRVGPEGVLPGSTAGGVVVCNAVLEQDSPSVVMTDGDPLVVWEDYRDFSTVANAKSDIYASKVAPDGVTPVLMHLVEARATPGAVWLMWEAAEGPGMARVERSKDAVTWLALGEILRDGVGRFSFVDREPAVGRSAYRLVDGSGVELVPPTWVDVPEAPRLGIQGLLVDRSAGDVSVAVTLASTRDARLELLDVFGRRLAALRFTPETSGPQSVRLGISPPAGIYFIRLDQGEAPVIRRAAFVK